MSTTGSSSMFLLTRSSCGATMRGYIYELFVMLRCSTAAHDVSGAACLETDGA